MNKNYVQGFMDKCAEYGLNPEQVVKSSVLQSELWDEKPEDLKVNTGDVQVKVQKPAVKAKPYKKEVLADMPANSGARAGRYNQLKAHAQKEIDDYAKERGSK